MHPLAADDETVVEIHEKESTKEPERTEPSKRSRKKRKEASRRRGRAAKFEGRKTRRERKTKIGGQS